MSDVENIQRCANAAYQPYVARIGKPPAPMVENFEALISARDVRIAEYQTAFAGFAIFRKKNQALFLQNIAVHPARQGHGVGRALIQYIERVAVRAHLKRIELYTNAKMTENLQLYARIGYVEVERRIEDGFNRVFFLKELG